MKKLLILLSLVAMVACTTKETSKIATLSGRVENLGDKVLILTDGAKTDTITVAEDGTFNFTKELKKAASFYLAIGRAYNNIYLAPAYDLVVNFNAEDLVATTEFNGSLAAENGYLKEIAALEQEHNAKMRELYVLSPDEYKTALESIRNSKEKLLDNYVAEHSGICKEFVKIQKLNYEFSYYSALSVYEPAHKHFAKVEEIELPENWEFYLNEIDINNADLLNVPTALNIVSNIMNRDIEKSGVASQEEDYGTPKLLGAQFDWILKKLENQDMKNYFLKKSVSSIVDHGGTGGIEEYVAKFYELCSDQDAIADLKEKEAEWAPLATGNEAPAFTIPDINENMVSLSDFKGKYVYIDFWATWCGPCKIEIPLLDELAKEYAGKNIEIISISVDRDKQAWIDMVTKDKPGWLQLHDGINMNDNYLVKFIPSFVLIDRDGNILRARAPRPSSGEVLTDLLNSLEGI